MPESPRTADIASPDVSVVVCTKDRPDDVERAIASIRASGPTGSAAEIVVVEEADTPRDLPGVRYVHLARRGLGFGHTRNAGVQHSSGSWLVFIDDDCEAAPGWLEALLEPLGANPELLGVAGAVEVRDCGPIGYAENILGFPGGGLRYVHDAAGRVVRIRHLSTCNCAYRRDAVLAAGGFPEDARAGGEDYVLAQRVCRRGACVFTPNARVYHRARDSFGGVFRWFLRRGRAEIDVLRHLEDRAAAIRGLARRSWTPRLLVAALAISLWPRLWLALPVAFLAYVAFMWWRYRFARRYPLHRKGWLAVPFVKLTMDAGAELGRLRALVRAS